MNQSVIFLCVFCSNETWSLSVTDEQKLETQVVVFRVVTPHSDVVGYQRFGGLSCFRLHPKDGDSTVHITTRCHFPGDHDFNLHM